MLYAWQRAAGAPCGREPGWHFFRQLRGYKAKGFLLPAPLSDSALFLDHV